MLYYSSVILHEWKEDYAVIFQDETFEKDVFDTVRSHMYSE